MQISDVTLPGLHNANVHMFIPGVLDVNEHVSLPDVLSANEHVSTRYSRCK